MVGKDRIDAELRLDQAIEGDEIVVHLQRQVDLRTGAVLGFEALARWEHPQRGIVGPDDFIPLAEETGQIVELGRRILVRACADQVELDRRVGGTPWLAVNVSVRQLENADFADELAGTLICGDPFRQFDESNTGDAFPEICRLHSHVIPNERDTRLDDAERSLSVAVLQQQVRAGAVTRDRLDQRLADLERELEIVRCTMNTTRATGQQMDHLPTDPALEWAMGSSHTIVDLPMLVFADVGRRLSHANDAGLALFGADPGELLGYHALDFVEASNFTASDPTVSPLANGAVDAFRARRTLLWHGRVVDAWIWGRTVPSPTGPIVWWTMLPATLAEDHPHRLAFWNSSPTLVTGTLDAAERHEVAVAVDQSIAVGPQGSNGRALAWMHPDDRPLVRRAQRAVANDRRAASCTVRLLHMEGHWVDATCTMIATRSADAPAAVAFICTASPKTHPG